MPGLSPNATWSLIAISLPRELAYSSKHKTSGVRCVGMYPSESKAVTKWPTNLVPVLLCCDVTITICAAGVQPHLQAPSSRPLASHGHGLTGLSPSPPPSKQHLIVIALSGSTGDQYHLQTLKESIENPASS